MLANIGTRKRLEAANRIKNIEAVDDFNEFGIPALYRWFRQQKPLSILSAKTLLGRHFWILTNFPDFFPLFNA